MALSNFAILAIIMGFLLAVVLAIIILLSTGAGDASRRRLAAGTKGIAIVWIYPPLNLPTGVQVYVNGIKKKLYRHRWIKNPTSEPGNGRLEIEYYNENGLTVPIECRDDKVTVDVLKTLENQYVPVFNVLSDKDKTPLMQEVESTREERDKWKRLYHRERHEKDELMLLEDARKAKLQQKRGRVASSRHPRGMGIRYPKRDSEDEGDEGDTGDEDEGDEE